MKSIESGCTNFYWRLSFASIVTILVTEMFVHIFTNAPYCLSISALLLFEIIRALMNSDENVAHEHYLRIKKFIIAYPLGVFIGLFLWGKYNGAEVMDSFIGGGIAGICCLLCNAFLYRETYLLSAAMDE